MVQKGKEEDNCRLRIDQVLVDKFRRLPAGINEVGTKIVRDFGLRYQYDKNRGTLDVIGPDTEILALAAETLRFWVEDDEYPDTGITCQIGYPNRSNVIWRFHGDYAKKFDHLFADEIAKLKLVTSVNIKAVPSKRNPEYVELYCHFSVYHQVKPELTRISRELGKIFQNDFFIPKSDFKKARDFAKSKVSDDKVLYALKEYPDNKVRVWLFARDQMDVIRAKREWVLHVGIIARDNEFTESIRRDSIKSASFFGHPASELGSDISGPTQPEKKDITGSMEQHLQPVVKQVPQTSLNSSNSMSRLKAHKNNSSKDVSPRGPRVDNSNFPRPIDFVYPIQRDEQKDASQTDDALEDAPINPFEANADMFGAISENGVLNASDVSGEAKWVPEGETNLYRARRLSKPYQSRIYVHQQMNEQQTQNTAVNSYNGTVGNTPGKQVVHPEKNLIEKERFNPTRHSVLTSVTDPKQAPATKKGNKGVRPGQKATKQGKVKAITRQKRPVLKTQKHSNIRYNININGLDIFMYKHDITKLGNMDALVNVVAPSLKEGDQTAETMFAMAGKKVLDELDVNLSLHGEAGMAENVVTSAGKLPALGIIHVVSPIWQRYTVWQDCASDLHKAIYNALKTAETHKYRKIAIPTIGSEPYFGIPKDLVAEVYVKALMDYSMGMGPMYPVLEIHLVDTDHNMLTYIKDAYESWSSTPGVADMTQHIRKESEHIMKDPKEVSARSQSAVSLKSMPSHRSENMVTFNGQSYTEEGEQKWTFDVLKKLVVHVYTGSILKVDEAEAVVCAVDANMKGTLAKQVELLAGKRYKAALKAARGNRTLVDGEVLVCDAGELRMRKVLHSIISSPVHVINQKNLSRLDSINTQVLYAANQHGIRILAMPLIGTGRLRERLEVEQCSLQLVDNIIELCLCLGKGLKLKELHLVNTNHVMTQYLTQALRTRAHTKLRVETEAHEPSRQEVLTKAEAIHRTPEKFDSASVKSMLSKASSTKSKEKKAVVGEDVNQKNEENITTGPEQEAANKEYKRQEPDSNEPKIENRPSTNKFNNKELHKNKTVNKKQSENKTGKSPYLSKEILKTHDRLIRDTWMHLMDDGIKGLEDGKQKVPKKQKQPKRHTELEPLNKKDSGTFLKKSEDLPTERKLNVHRKKNLKHRIIQRSSDFIYQRSRAESYKMIFEKKQKYAENAQKQEQVKLRKTQSSDDILKKQIADDVFETFKEERRKLSIQKKQALKHNEHLTDDEKLEKEKMQNAPKKYFTRDTKDRYKQLEPTDDPNDKFERFNRIDVKDAETENDFAIENKPLKKTLSERQQHFQTLKKIRKERHLIDKEREDQYMMDMDFLAKEREESERMKEQEIETHEEENYYQAYNINQNEKGPTSNEERYQTPSERIHTEHDQQLVSARTFPLKRHSTPVGHYLQYESMKTPKVSRNDSNIKLENDPGVDEVQPNHLTEESGGKQITSYVFDPKPSKDLSDGHLVLDGSTDFHHLETNSLPNKSETTATGKQIKRHIASNSRESGVIKSQLSSSTSGRRQSVGRVKFKDDDRLTEEREITAVMPRSVEWQNGKKVTKKGLQIFTERRRHARAMKAMQPDDIKIRDNLKLQINVVDKNVVDDEKIQEEKRKIRRFWEVVSSSGTKDEKEMFGDVGDNNDKMLVATVTKERVMSAKTKDSKQSNTTAVTHNVGDYNVTLAVGN